MNNITYYMKVTAIEPISHIGESAGIGSLFNQEEIIMPGGRKTRVPCITGAAGKGILRRVGMEVMLALLGLDPEKANYLSHDQANPLTQHKLEVLFNGSILTSVGERGVKVDVGAQLAELIPWFAMVGGCLGNQMLKGRMAVDNLILICQENEWRLKMIDQDIKQVTGTDGLEVMPTHDLLSAREHLSMYKRSHKDDFKGGSVLRFLPPGKREQILLLQAENQKEREGAGWQDEEAGQHVQMRYEVQGIKAGSQFFWSITGMDWTDLMHDAFQTTLAFFLSRPYLGGMSARGFGRVHLEFLGANVVEPAQGRLETALAPKPGDLYRNHLDQRRDEIINLLKALEK